MHNIINNNNNDNYDNNNTKIQTIYKQEQQKLNKNTRNAHSTRIYPDIQSNK